VYTLHYAAFENFQYLNSEAALEVAQVKDLYKELGFDV
jgi:hypothetical protein